MRIFKVILLFAFLIFTFHGCGYTTRSYTGIYKTIYVAPFKNEINIADEKASYSKYMTYYPLLESTITQAVVNRFIFDGSLKVVKEQDADVILKGELVSYNRDAVRYADNNEDVQEYRITLTINMALYKGDTGELIWQKNGFSGDTSYYISGTRAKSEKDALDNAISDLSRRVVEEFVEAW
jgi:hypothetical protein